jgi:hypothetical protein
MVFSNLPIQMSQKQTLRALHQQSNLHLERKSILMDESNNGLLLSALQK